ncbi:MAG: hypothetical protein LQ346_008996 [Caloplaca aetnensis]|nr:MAG: hypothetical protein LQ346_008996 [Caloplaca aetnensis]
MGNQHSTTGRKKNALTLLRERVFSPDSEREETLSRQETLRPVPSTNSSRSSESNFALRSSKSSSSTYAATVDSYILPPHSIGTHSASTPKEKPCRLEIRVPSLMTDAERMALCLDEMSSPSETSTETQCVLETADTAVPSSSLLTPPLQEGHEQSVSSRSRPSSSSTSSKQPTLDQPLSSPELVPVRSNPYSLFSVPKLEKVAAPPLLPSHFDCYQSHRRMIVSRNVHCPLPCVVCKVEDEQVRWKCIWCCLRICGGCMESLDKIERRDLRTLVRKLEPTNEGVAAESGEGNAGSDLNGEQATPARSASAQAEKVERRDQEEAS